MTNPKNVRLPLADIGIDDIFFDEGMCPPGGPRQDFDPETEKLRKKDRNILLL